MKIFKLIPSEDQLNNHNWEASKYKGEVVVVAENENDARRMANSNIGTLSAAGKNSPVKPWNNKIIVQCAEFEDENIKKDIARIVSPEEYNEEE